MLSNPLKSSFFKDQIAVILIIGAFASIIMILAIHMYTSSIIITEYQKKANDSAAMTNLSNAYKDINASNLNVFSIIFSLFGAWVGAVLAFYFGAQSLERAHDSLNKAQESISNIISDNRMATLTVKEVIEKNPDCKNILPLTFDKPINEIVKGAKDKDYKFVMIADNDNAPTTVHGLLFISDLKGDKSEKDLESETRSLRQFLEDSQINIIDNITKQKWTTQGVQNFVPTTLDENLKALYEKMIKKDPSLSVRAVAFDKNKAIATITYENILNTIKK